jgi:hypothetical protein
VITFIDTRKIQQGLKPWDQLTHQDTFILKGLLYIPLERATGGGWKVSDRKMVQISASGSSMVTITEVDYVSFAVPVDIQITVKELK